MLAARLSPQQMQELVGPIALYPDALVAQILAASAYPTQIVEANRFLQQNPNLTGAALGSEVDKQDWDPSVKALTQFPSVLADMDKNLSWTSTLGDASTNQQADVMNAIQFMRQRAQQAGNLQSTPQQTVTDQGSNVIIQPADPQVVYVPDYDPEDVYGYPVGLWPGFDPWWGVGGPYLSFGIGYGIGPFWGFGWGWGAGAVTGSAGACCMVAEPMDSRAAGFMIGTRSSMEITADTLRRERAGIVWPVEMVSREEIASREETALRVVTPHQTRWLCSLALCARRYHNAGIRRTICPWIQLFG